MKKILALIGLISSMYAIPPCELPEQKVCTYFYQGSMSAEIIVTNLLPDTIIVEYAGGMLDGSTKNISNLKLETGQSHKLLKSIYKDHEGKSFYRINSMRYRVITKNSTLEAPKPSLSNNERKQNIKIEMH